MTRISTQIRVDLAILEPWGVGGLDVGDDVVDLPIQVDPRTRPVRPYVPSTSLIGALRAHLTQVMGGDDAARWLGPLPAGHEVRTGKLARKPSRLWALGTRLDNPTTISALGSTAIEPRNGSAFGGSLRLAERVDVAPKSAATPNERTALMWYLQHDSGRDPDLLNALATWTPFVGRRRSAGQGDTRVTQVTAFEVDLHTVKGLTWWLQERAGWLAGGEPPGFVDRTVLRDMASRRAASLRLGWKVREPLHVGTGEEGSEPARRGQARQQHKTCGFPSIPGSSWKGIFRHRVKRILLLRGASPDQSRGIIAHLFGEGGTAKGDSTGRRGVLRFGESLLVDTDGRPAPTVIRTHVAIDRVSGGPHEGLLFNVSAVEEGAGTTLTISSDEALPAPLANLLLHVARDIHDGLVGVGGGTTRGYGWLQLTEPKLLDSLSPVRVPDVLACLPAASVAVVPSENAAGPPPTPPSREVAP